MNNVAFEQFEQLQAVFYKPPCERMNKGLYEKRSQLFKLFNRKGSPFDFWAHSRTWVTLVGRRLAYRPYLGHRRDGPGTARVCQAVLAWQGVAS